MGKRHGQTPLNILDEPPHAIVGYGLDEPAIMDDGINYGVPIPHFEEDVARANIPNEYAGLDREGARKAEIVRLFEEAGLLQEIEKLKIEQPFGDRSGVVIEPWMTDQWYVDAKTLAEPAIAAVKEGKTRFVPQNWEKTYYNWMDNIQPWCISRQLWWGHRIPVWYGPERLQGYKG